MTPEEFRTAGHQLIDWIADYRGGIEGRPVRAQVEPGDVKNALPAQAPEVPRWRRRYDVSLRKLAVPLMRLAERSRLF